MDTQLSIAEFDYPLPDHRIAKHPLARRDQCKLLVCGPDGRIADHVFADLPALLPDDALLVCNNTRVINARLRFRKGGDGALIEVFCLEPRLPEDYALNFAAEAECQWTCMIGNSKRWKDGELVGDCHGLRARRLSRDGAQSVVRFTWDTGVPFSQVIADAGEIPIPPYLNRGTERSDSSDYQTVYSRVDGSVAAPTAGLHFTPEVLAAIDARGLPRRELTLHVGAGTFAPVKADRIADHAMHSEFISVPRALIEELRDTPRRVVAVGTTSVRTLESLYHLGCLRSQGQAAADELPQWYPYSPGHPGLDLPQAMQALLDTMEGDTLIASTRLMIAPGYRYRVVRGMVTNFHQPRSTLLLLVSAYLGRRSWRGVYDHALASGYRFLSYGDACLFL